MSETTWQAVQRSMAANRCRCPLREGMNATELRELGAGCRAPAYVCPALDGYRRRVGFGPLEPLAAPEPKPMRPKKVQWTPYQTQVRQG